MGGTLAAANDDYESYPETHHTCVMVKVPYKKYTGIARNCCSGDDQKIESIQYDDSRAETECYHPQDKWEKFQFNNGAGCDDQNINADGNVFSKEDTDALIRWADKSSCV